MAGPIQIMGKSPINLDTLISVMLTQRFFNLLTHLQPYRYLCMTTVRNSTTETFTRPRICSGVCGTPVAKNGKNEDAGKLSSKCRLRVFIYGLVGEDESAPQTAVSRFDRPKLPLKARLPPTRTGI